MRYLIYGLLFISTSTLAQTYPVPIAILDSMIFEVQRGRACNALAEAQANEIHVQGKLLLTKDKALNLSQSIVQAREQENLELRQVIKDSNTLTEVKVKNERKKGFKRGLGIGLLGVIVVLLL